MTDLQRGKRITKKCEECGEAMSVRVADHNRGWGKFCSKSCKAKFQTAKTGIAGPNYRASNKTVKQMAAGKFSPSIFKKTKPVKRGYLTIVAYEPWDDEVINGDVAYSNKHGCWIDFREDAGEHPFDSDAAGFNNT